MSVILTRSAAASLAALVTLAFWAPSVAPITQVAHATAIAAPVLA